MSGNQVETWLLTTDILVWNTMFFVKEKYESLNLAMLVQDYIKYAMLLYFYTDKVFTNII